MKNFIKKRTNEVCMITVNEMKALENQAVANGISKLELMERAGDAISEELRGFDKILFICYHGNNGGDGFNAAKKLIETNEVDVFFIGKEEKLKKEARQNFNTLKNIEQETGKEIFLRKKLDEDQYDVIVDCILGIGVKGELKEPILSAINLINRAKFVVSVDVPTGINADTGEKQKLFVCPDLIITLHDIKKGLERYEKITKVVDIGL